MGKRQPDLRSLVPLGPSSKPFAALGARIVGLRVLGVEVTLPHCPALVFSRGASWQPVEAGSRGAFVLADVTWAVRDGQKQKEDQTFDF